MARNLNGLQSPFGTYATRSARTGDLLQERHSAGRDVRDEQCDPDDELAAGGLHAGHRRGLCESGDEPVPVEDAESVERVVRQPGVQLDPDRCSSFESALARHVNGWNFHDTFFVTYKQSYLTALGFNFANWETAQFNAATNTATCSPRGANAPWCVSPNTTTLHNSPAKPCPIQPTMNVTDKTLSSKSVKVTFDNNTGVAQTLTGLAITWPQATNGNLLSIKLGSTTIYSTSTGGGSLNTSSLLGTAAQRTISGGQERDADLHVREQREHERGELHRLGHVQPVRPGDLTAVGNTGRQAF